MNSRRSSLGLTRFVQSVSDAVVSLAEAEFAVWMRLPFSFLSGPSAPTKQQTRLLADVQSVANLLRKAKGSGLEDELFKLLQALTENRDQVERAFVVWVDLLEVLVQQTEVQFGPQKGAGALKAEEVKATIWYLLRTKKFNFPDVPQQVQRLIAEVFSGWVIDAVVAACNGYGLWQQPGPSPSFWKSFLDRVWKWLWKVFGGVASAIASGIENIIDLSQQRVVIGPNLQAALDAVEKDGMIASSGGLVRDLIEILVWIGSHSEQVIATFKVVLEAVQQAESFLTMTGPDKKVYATDLVMAVLEEMGFTSDSGLIHDFVASGVSAMIEVGVHLFNKHDVF
jgi:hypothetical protein